MILAPAAMTAEKDPKKAAAKCFESINLDPESYRIGHTKARICSPIFHILFCYGNGNQLAENLEIFFIFDSRFTAEKFLFSVF